MTASKLINGITRLWKLGNRQVRQFDAWTHGWFGILIGAVNQAIKPYSIITAAAISYFAIFSLFPLILLSIGIASFGFGSFLDQQTIIQRLEFVTPALGQLLGKNIAEVIRARGPVTIVALIGLIWSASTFFFILTGTMNEIWGIERRRAVWKRRGMAILFVLVIVGPILFLASVANSMIGNLLLWLPVQTIQIVKSVSLIAAILLDVALFLAVYLLLPHANAGWRDILPGAVGAGLLWEIAKKTFLFFVSTYLSVSNLVYGSVAAIIAILTWSYLSGLIFLYGAYLNVAYHRLKQEKQGGVD